MKNVGVVDAEYVVHIGLPTPSVSRMTIRQVSWNLGLFTCYKIVTPGELSGLLKC